MPASGDADGGSEGASGSGPANGTDGGSVRPLLDETDAEIEARLTAAEKAASQGLAAEIKGGGPGQHAGAGEASGGVGVAGAPAESVPCEPSVVLDRDGDRISKIRVMCSCGRSVVLDCHYQG